jgi:hypothetical protein
MKKVFCILMVLCFMGCAKVQEGPAKTPGNAENAGNSSCYVAMIDGCEYIYCNGGYGYGIAITPKLNQTNKFVCGGR